MLESMSDFKNLLLTRRAEVNGSLPRLYDECTELRKALVIAEGKINAARGELQQIELALTNIDKAQAKVGRVTIMQAVLDVLNHKSEGMTAQEILAEINAKYFNGTIVRPSLSPQLSRLKDRDKKIELRGNRWFRLPDEPLLFSKKE